VCRAAWLLGAGVFAIAQPTMNATEVSSTNPQVELATFGGGCFWCLEAVFEQVPGVLSVTNGYAGGTKPNPTYKEVCSGLTGHAEVVQVSFDPAKVSYERLLDIFWEVHDPTSLNRQGNDVGTQYRSVIFYHTEQQRRAAERSKAAAQRRFTRPIVTEIVPLTRFYPAEGYHQGYYRNHPEAPYCRLVIRPKVEHIQKRLNQP
jgi:peptide-methionine (S)-S-oxide reductase